MSTILGRQRQLPDARTGSKAAQGHALRAAINTPIQGSAADIATAAMLRIDADEALRDMGWRLLLQVGAVGVSCCGGAVGVTRRQRWGGMLAGTAGGSLMAAEVIGFNQQDSCTSVQCCSFTTAPALCSRLRCTTR